MAKIRFGTCSWKYDSWKDLVYSSDTVNYLEEYSKKYSTVEIDQWFWSLHGINNVTLPQPKVVEEYFNSVPDNFLFTIKIPNSITLTHFYKKDKSGALVENPYFLNPELFNQFLETIKPLRPKVGPLMFQFEYLNKLKMNNLDEFIERFEKFINTVDNSFEYAIEIRNPNYLNNNYFEFLRRNNLRMVFLQGYFMPHIWKIYDKYGGFLTDTVIIRLHGDDRKGIEEKSNAKWNKIITPRDEEIHEVKKMIDDLQVQEIGTYVNVNNHYEGSAPLTIEKLLK